MLVLTLALSQDLFQPQDLFGPGSKAQSQALLSLRPLCGSSLASPSSEEPAPEDLGFRCFSLLGLLTLPLTSGPRAITSQTREGPGLGTLQRPPVPLPCAGGHPGWRVTQPTSLTHLFPAASSLWPQCDHLPRSGKQAPFSPRRGDQPGLRKGAFPLCSEAVRLDSVRIPWRAVETGGPPHPRKSGARSENCTCSGTTL